MKQIILTLILLLSISVHSFGQKTSSISEGHTNLPNTANGCIYEKEVPDFTEAFSLFVEIKAKYKPEYPMKTYTDKENVLQQCTFSSNGCEFNFYVINSFDVVAMLSIKQSKTKLFPDLPDRILILYKIGKKI